jgi:hypothetical protein
MHCPYDRSKQSGEEHKNHRASQKADECRGFVGVSVGVSQHPD